jgi:prepilin-type N-terminal cleavage/methylation domain-containing protein
LLVKILYFYPYCFVVLNLKIIVGIYFAITQSAINNKARRQHCRQIINILKKENEMMLKKTKNQKGFTLIELLIVVAIIGILAAIAIPQFASYRQKAFNSAAQSDLKTIRTSLEGFYTDNFYYPY